MKLNRLPFDQDRLKSLNSKAVQCRSAVEHHRVLANHFIENIPNLGPFFFDHFLCALDRGDEAALFELVIDKRLEQLQSHLLRQPALVQPQFRSDNDHRTSGIVHPFAEQVLAESAGFTFKHIAQGLKRPAILAGDSSPTPAVIK